MKLFDPPAKRIAIEHALRIVEGLNRLCRQQHPVERIGASVADLLCGDRGHLEGLAPLLADHQRERDADRADIEHGETLGAVVARGHF